MTEKLYLEGIENYKPPYSKEEIRQRRYRPQIYADKVRFRPERTEEKDRLR